MFAHALMRSNNIESIHDTAPLTEGRDEVLINAAIQVYVRRFMNMTLDIQQHSSVSHSHNV